MKHFLVINRFAWRFMLLACNIDAATLRKSHFLFYDNHGGRYKAQNSTSSLVTVPLRTRRNEQLPRLAKKDTTGQERELQQAHMWVFKGNLLKPDDYSEFGDAGVAISDDGNRLFVARASLGYIMAYEIKQNAASDLRWEQLGSSAITSTGPISVSYGGHRRLIAIDSSGSIVAVASREVVEVFILQGGDWRAMGSALPGPRVIDANSDHTGTTIALSKDGRRLAVGTPFDTDVGEIARRGIVKVYRWSVEDQKWNQLGSTLMGLEADDVFGYSVDLDRTGNRLAVAAPGTNLFDVGYAALFDYGDEDWSLSYTIYDEDDRRPTRVALSSNDGKRLAVDANDGQLILWEETGSGDSSAGWHRLLTLSDAIPSSYGIYVNDFALSGDGSVLVVGRSLNGDVHVYKEGDWGDALGPSDRISCSADDGIAVAASGMTIACAAGYDSDNSGDVVAVFTSIEDSSDTSSPPFELPPVSPPASSPTRDTTSGSGGGDPTVVSDDDPGWQPTASNPLTGESQPSSKSSSVAWWVYVVGILVPIASILLVVLEITRDVCGIAEFCRGFGKPTPSLGVTNNITVVNHNSNHNNSSQGEQQRGGNPTEPTITRESRTLPEQHQDKEQAPDKESSATA